MLPSQHIDRLLRRPFTEKKEFDWGDSTKGTRVGMNFRQVLASVAPDRETVLTVGVFDGVHQGHCYLIRSLIQQAGSTYVSTVLTFANHPITVLRPGSHVGYITSPEDKLRLLKEQGVELAVCLDFTQELSQVSAHEFTTTLVESLHMKGLVVGPDFALGHDRQGDLNFLRQMGSEMGFWVETVDTLMMDGGLVKSRRIRAGLEQGNVAACARLLGRNFSLRGLVVKGDRRGQELGFPTANLEVAPQMALPGDGIYATWAIIDGVRHPSATSIGVRPTFALTKRLVEVYVIDFNADLYDRQMSIEFVRKLRDQEAFSSVEALVDQIGLDVANSREALAQDEGADVA
jgi:riboflavin kinase/FMN adenylyltransferase